ncbi:hypothetical protein CLOP_g11269 [Closterium sp. NIES-67]|nr:hypothetical protein CLOP_g11269 [Closterium sp. NIES-67]
MKLIKRKQGPLSYIVENLDVADDERALVREAHQAVTAELGHGVAWDAAQMGSRTHRVRRYWQNLVPEPVLRDQLSRMQRPVPRQVQDILEPGRRPAPVTTPEVKTQFPCNQVGEPRQAWPTLVATPGSYAFRMQGSEPGPGMVQVLATGQWEEPMADLQTMLESDPAQALDMAEAWQRMKAEAWAEVERGENQLNIRGIALLAKAMQEAEAVEEIKEEGESKPVEEEKGPPQVDSPPAWEMGDGLEEEQKGELRRVLEGARGAFAYSLKELGKCTIAEMEIELQSNEPVYQRRRRMSPGDRDIAVAKCAELLEAGLIRESTSEYAAATVVAARKDLTGETLARRMCGDYRGLNRITKSDRYPMPMAEEIFDKLAAGQVYSTLDLRQGFNQIPIKEEDKAKTAFHGPDRLYEWNYMPFGLKNASARFQRVMDQVLREVPRALCYIDDVVIFSENGLQHVADVADALAAIQAAGLKCHPGKCHFGVRTVAYLGFQVGKGGLSVQQAKVEHPPRSAGLSELLPQVRAELQQDGKALESAPERGHDLEVGGRTGSGVEDLEGSSEDRACPETASPDKPYTLYTDWSSSGMGAVLCQLDGGTERVVAYASRSCSPAESNYSSYEGEGLAAVWAVELFRPYLQGRKFTLVTDHQPLLWLMTNQTLKGRNARWAMRLQEFEFDVKHRPGKTLQHVDGLSRQGPAIAGEPELSHKSHERKSVMRYMGQRGREEV